MKQFEIKVLHNINIQFRILLGNSDLTSQFILCVKLMKQKKASEVPLGAK